MRSQLKLETSENRLIEQSQGSEFEILQKGQPLQESGSLTSYEGQKISAQLLRSSGELALIADILPDQIEWLQQARRLDEFRFLSPEPPKGDNSVPPSPSPKTLNKKCSQSELEDYISNQREFVEKFGSISRDEKDNEQMKKLVEDVVTYFNTKANEKKQQRPRPKYTYPIKCPREFNEYLDFMQSELQTIMNVNNYQREKYPIKQCLELGCSFIYVETEEDKKVQTYYCLMCMQELSKL